MKVFNVIWWDFNEEGPTPYNVMPHFVECYKKAKVKPTTYEDFKKFVEKESMFKYWARAQYEIIIKKWPPSEATKKIDIHSQIMMNIDIVINLLMEEVKKK